jgi:hypothetical protein
MISSSALPLYAFLTHAITFIILVGVSLNTKMRFPSFIIASIIAAYFVTFLWLDDYGNYAYIYSELDTNKSLDQIFLLYGEPLYLSVNYLFKFFTDDFNIVRFFWVLIALVIKLNFLMRWGKFYTISFIFYIALLFYPDSYLLRSTIASSIVFIGISAMLENKKAYRFFIPILIASGFHISALIALPIWFFKNINISKNLAFIVLGLLFFSGFIGLGHLIVDIIGSTFSSNAYYIERVVEYADSIYGESLGMLRGSVLVYLTVAILFIAYKDQISQQTPHYSIFLNIMLYSFIFLFSFSDFEVLSERLFRILAFILVIPVGHILFCIKKDDKVYFAAATVIFLNIIGYIIDAGPYQLLNSMVN